MSKHAIPTIWPDTKTKDPAHSTGWTDYRASYDHYAGTFWDYTPGKHAKPFGRHSIRTAQDIYDRYGHQVSLTPPANALDVAA